MDRGWCSCTGSYVVLDVRLKARVLGRKAGLGLSKTREVASVVVRGGRRRISDVNRSMPL